MFQGGQSCCLHDLKRVSVEMPASNSPCLMMTTVLLVTFTSFLLGCCALVVAALVSRANGQFQGNINDNATLRNGTHVQCAGLEGCLLPKHLQQWWKQ